MNMIRYLLMMVMSFGIMQCSRAMSSSSDTEQYMASRESLEKFMKAEQIKIKKSMELWDAIDKGNLRAIGSLLTQGADPNLRDENGFTAFHYILKYRASCVVDDSIFQEAIKVLVNRGANINAQTNTGVTPLHVSVVSGDVSMVTRLVRLGANLLLKDEKGKTPLMYAKERLANLQATFESRDMDLKNAQTIVKILAEREGVLRRFDGLNY